jgi:uncharacterized protein
MNMLFIRLCFDKSGLGALREEHRAAHRAYLKSGAIKLVQAGPLMDNDNKHNIASFMIVEADSLDQVNRFHDGDPFTKVGLFERSFIHIWDKHVG